MGWTSVAITQTQGIQRAQRGRSGTRDINVGTAERWASVIGGGVLALYGLTRGSLGSTLLGLTGGFLVYRGATGHCHLYGALDINTAAQMRRPLLSVPYNQGIRVEKAVTIDKSPEELYRFWHNFENLPRFMHHLHSVTTISDKLSHWVAKAPAGMTVAWDAEIINDQKNEWIAWRSLPNADVDHAGSVHFNRAPVGRGTEVKVEMEYRPPAGKIGAAIAHLFGGGPALQVEEDLDRLKQMIEAGEVAVTGDRYPGDGQHAAPGWAEPH